MLLHVVRSFRERRRARARARRKGAARLVLRDRLEPRMLLSGVPDAGAGPSAVVMLSATTTDSKGVTVDYQVGASGVGARGVQFGVYRSADPTFDGSDVLLGSWTAAPDSGFATSGVHEATIPLKGGLPIDPARPYVLVVANPGDPGATTDAGRTAAFRTYSIGVVTHGGIINPSWKVAPPWALQIGKLMERAGYDAVIPYGWVKDSNIPGRAAQQGPRLARRINALAEQFPASSVVDLHMVGHSEGTVVNSLALSILQTTASPQLRRGFVQDTMLDPHAANNNSPGQFSTSKSIIGALAHSIVSGFQQKAEDPAVFVPANVDAAEVFYQHSSVQNSHEGGDYNLWGQVPVPNRSDGLIHYYNLTATGASHSGNYGVPLWYRNFVATTLRQQSPLIQTLQLDGRLDDATGAEPPTSRVEEVRDANWGPVRTIDGDRPVFSGTAAAGSTVRLYVGPTGDLTRIGLMATTTADASGAWTATPRRPLPDGRYRAVAMAYSKALRTRPAFAVAPMAPMGRFVIGKGRSS